MVKRYDPEGKLPYADLVLGSDYDALAAELATLQDVSAAQAAVGTRALDRIRALEAALTPSADTKADYMGEFTFDAFEDMHVIVPWTTIKEIMAHILKRATAETKGDAKTFDTYEPMDNCVNCGRRPSDHDIETAACSVANRSSVENGK